ncbi:MAG: anion permease [Clostridia bacterium]|nr:anion permease [Clostridia bacterium]
MSQITIVALVIFAITYVLMLIFQKIRPYIVGVSALLFVGLGVIATLKPDLFGAEFFNVGDGVYTYGILDALKNIDWNVIMMIAGTMGTVYLFIESKMPQLLSDVLISKMPNVKWVVVVISLFAGIVSAFVDNVATVLMIAPVALAFCKKLNISPVASIICIAVSSNLQGAATLVGDTTSILLGKAANLDFSSFFVDKALDGSSKPGMFWVVEAGAIVAALIILFMFRKEKGKISFKGETKVEDYFPTILLVGTVVALIGVSFIPYYQGEGDFRFFEQTADGLKIYKPDITNGILCIAIFLIGAFRELVIKKNKAVVKNAFKEIDYYTIALLTFLFIVIGGIESAGVVDVIGNVIKNLGGGSPFLVFTIIVWASVILSAFIDNIPYTATMLAIVPVIAEGFPGMDPKLLYYGLLCGATLGGNLTPIGASANIAGIGILRKEGHEVKSTTFMKYGVPFTLAAVTTGYLMLWFIWG